MVNLRPQKLTIASDRRDPFNLHLSIGTQISDPALRNDGRLPRSAKLTFRDSIDD
jgi:hypothetical protein